jgi:hypothetical protein
MKKFKVKELRFSNLLVEDINVPKNLIVRIKNIPRSKKALLEEVAKKISEKYGKDVKHFILEDLEIEGPKNFAKNPTITKRRQKRRKVLKNYIDEIGEEDSQLSYEVIKDIINVFGEKFLDKYSVIIRDQIEKFSKKIAGLKTLADRPKDDPYKKRLDNWRIG